MIEAVGARAVAVGLDLVVRGLVEVRADVLEAVDLVALALVGRAVSFHAWTRMETV